MHPIEKLKLIHTQHGKLHSERYLNTTFDHISEPAIIWVLRGSLEYNWVSISNTKSNSMNNVGENGFLNLTVRNFGPIKECSIDVRPLTVFVGPSNTGKSYLAILLYALHKGFRFGNRRGIRLRRSSFSSEEDRGDQKNNKYEQVISSFQRSVLEAESSLANNDRNDIKMTLYKPVMDLVNSTIVDQDLIITKEIERCFGSSLKELVRYRSKGESSIVIDVRNENKASNMKLWYDNRTQTIKTEIPNELTIDIADGYSLREIRKSVFPSINKNEPESKFQREFNFLSGISELIESLISDFLGTLRMPIYYLPADRTGIMHAHSVVVSSLLESASMRGLRRSFDTPLLSGVLADFLEKLIVKKSSALFLRGNSRKSRSTVGEDIERQLLGGTIIKRRAELTDYPEYSYHPNNWRRDLSLINSSSMVSELAPVVLYLKEHVKEGDFIIVEEPESHLHPAKQVIFMQILAKLVKTGVRVVVITHSEWIIEELANIVNRHKANVITSKQRPDEIPILNTDQVGVWLFQKRKSAAGSVVKEINLDASGLYPTEYDDVAEQLHNEWVKIQREIGENE